MITRLKTDGQVLLASQPPRHQAINLDNLRRAVREVYPNRCWLARRRDSSHIYEIFVYNGAKGMLNGSFIHVADWNDTLGGSITWISERVQPKRKVVEVYSIDKLLDLIK